MRVVGGRIVGANERRYRCCPEPFLRQVNELATRREAAMVVHPLRGVAEALIAATSAGDADAVVALFTSDAVIDDPSTGYRFGGHVGIRDYVERFFVGCHTVTR